MARTDRDAGIPAEDRDPDLLTAEELAGELGVEVQLVRVLGAAGVLPGLQAGYQWIFSRAIVAARIADHGVDVRDYLTAEQLAGKLDMDVQTIRDLAAAGVLPAEQAGRWWLFRWAAIYALIAGPGVPSGDVLSARQLAARLGVPVRVVQRAAAVPGTPGKLPGRQIGKQWRFAWEAVRRQSFGLPIPATSHSRRASVSGSGQPGDRAG